MNALNTYCCKLFYTFLKLLKKKNIILRSHFVAYLVRKRIFIILYATFSDISSEKKTRSLYHQSFQNASRYFKIYTSLPWLGRFS